jgi:hypothetical protein
MYAALLNALEVVGKKIEDVRVVFSGVGAGQPEFADELGNDRLACPEARDFTLEEFAALLAVLADVPLLEPGPNLGAAAR